MQPSNLFDGLELNQHLVLDHEVCPIGNVELETIEVQWNRNLLNCVEAVGAQAVGETSPVHRLEQPRSQRTMDVQCRPDDSIGKIAVNVAGKRTVHFFLPWTRTLKAASG